jgi:hypothetical protein
MEFFWEQISWGRERKLDGPSKKRWGRLCVHVHILSACPPVLPADFKERAGRTQGLHNHLRAPSIEPSKSPAPQTWHWTRLFAG